MITDVRKTERTLIRERGCKTVTREELAGYDAPLPVGRWFPLRHDYVVDSVEQSLNAMGFRVKDAELVIARNGDRFFGTMDLESPITDGVSLAVGVANSIDRSTGLKFCIGTRVFVCANLCFNSEVIVARKHTARGAIHFSRDINEAIGKLSCYQEEERRRIDVMRNAAIGDMAAESLIIRAMDAGIITSQDIPKVLTEWRVPEHKEFEDKTLWSLSNAFTSALKPKCIANPQRYASLTMKLSSHLIPQEYLSTLAS